MHNDNRHLLDTDWGDLWDSLPEAPALVPRRKTAQLTLRLSDGLLARAKAVAAAQSLPYHAVVRSWIEDGLRHLELPGSSATDEEPQSAQLNLKVDQEFLDALKKRASESRRPYHTLARQLLTRAVQREEARLGEGTRARHVAMRDLIVLLLHSQDNRGADAIRGMTRLQKLLFVIEQKVTGPQHFYAYNYGPFDEAVHDAVNALRLAGFLSGSAAVKQSAPSFADMVQSVAQRSGPSPSTAPDLYVLNDRGHLAAEHLRRSSRAYEALFQRIAEIRHDWDTPQLDDLVDRVYAEWPAYAENSLIREKVADRSRPRRP